MALSYVTYAGDGSTTNFSVTFPYIAQADVGVYVDGVLKTVTTDYTWFSSTVIQFVVAPAAAAVITFRRGTEQTTRLIDFQDAGNLTEYDLDLSANQLFYLVQEGLDNVNDLAMLLDTDNKWNAESHVIKNLADPTNAQDACTKNYIDVTWTAYMDAAVAAAAASASAASTSETNAAASETAAALSYDQFDDRYLGSKTSDPALDNDGNPLLTGALYWNSTNSVMRAYDGSLWTDVGQSTANVTEWTCTAGQTTFSGNDDNAKLLAYKVGYLMVFLNGVLLDPDDYTASTGSSVVLNSACSSGDNVNIIGYGTFDVANTYTQAQADAQFAPITTPGKNILINGEFLVSQRAASTPVASSSASYTADRWRASNGSAGAITVAPASHAFASAPFAKELDITVTTADATVGATDLVTFGQRVEGYELSDLAFGVAAAKSVTLHFWTAHSQTGTFSVSIRNGANNRSYVAEYTQTSAGVWEEHTITIPGCTDGTWTIDNTHQMTVDFALMVGSTYQTTAGSWQTGLYFGTSSQPNVLSSTSNVFRVAGVKLEVGSVATDWVAESYSELLTKCQRYFEKSYDPAEYPGTASVHGDEFFNVTAIASGLHQGGAGVKFQVPKRSTPAVTLYSNITGTAGKVRDNMNSADITGTADHSGYQGFRWYAVMTTAATAVNMTLHWAADAEL